MGAGSGTGVEVGFGTGVEIGSGIGVGIGSGAVVGVGLRIGVGVGSGAGAGITFIISKKGIGCGVSFAGFNHITISKTTIIVR